MLKIPRFNNYLEQTGSRIKEHQELEGLQETQYLVNKSYQVLLLIFLLVMCTYFVCAPRTPQSQAEGTLPVKKFN